MSGGGSISGGSKAGGTGNSWAGEGVAEGGGGGGEDDASAAAAALAALRQEEEESARVQRIMAELSKLGRKQDRMEASVPASDENCPSAFALGTAA